MVREVDFNEEEIRGLYVREMAGERLNRSEAALLARWEKAEAEIRKWQILEALPKKDWITMSGRQQKILDGQAERYGLDELLKPKINVGRLVKQIHDMLAKHWVKFSAEASASDLMSGGGKSAALERWRTAQAEKAEMEVATRRRELVPVDELRDKLGSLAAMARTRGEAMERAGGPLVRREFDLLIDDWIDAVRRWFPDETEGVTEANTVNDRRNRA